MDPDELLKQLRVLVNGVLAGPNADIIIQGDHAKMIWWRNLASDMTVTVNDLDHWLSNGGFPPREWRQYDE